MQFKKVYIVGNGVMGKLLHKRIEKFYEAKVITYDIEDELSFAKADQFTPNLVIVATPISTISSVLQKINNLNPSFTFVCEIGSVKGDLHKTYTSIMSPKGSLFFESVHPMVGPLATDWDVLNWNKPCIIIQEDCSQIPDTNEIAKFWRELGFVIKHMEPEQHDKIIGKLSHLSHFMVMAYVDFVQSTLEPHELALAGPSFEKFKELAEGAKRLKDIYTNNDSMQELISEFSGHMKNIILEK